MRFDNFYFQVTNRFEIFKKRILCSSSIQIGIIFVKNVKSSQRKSYIIIFFVTEKKIQKIQNFYVGTYIGTHLYLATSTHFKAKRKILFVTNIQKLYSKHCKMYINQIVYSKVCQSSYFIELLMLIMIRYLLFAGKICIN